MLQADVVLFAGVLHDHVFRGLQGPRSCVHPIVSVGFRIMNRHRVQDRKRVGTGERIDVLHIFAVRVPDGVESGVSVEARRLDDKRVTVPARGGDSRPARRQVCRPFKIRIQ